MAQQRSLTTRQCILTATAQLLLESGPEGTTTNHIAERSGYSIGAVYQHFSNKEDIYANLMESVLQAPVDAIVDFEPAATLTATLEKLIVEAAAGVAGQDPELWRVLETIPGGTFALKRAAARERAIAIVERAFEPFAAEIVPDDLALSARLMVTAVEGFALAADRTLFESAAFYQECHRLLYAYLKYQEQSDERQT